MEFDRQSAPYASCFCEENIWQLANELTSRKLLSENSFVLLLFNEHEFIAVQNQKAFPPGEVGFWDYHVILLDQDNDRLFDLDTRLIYPCPVKEYFQETFPNQSTLPAEFRTMVRCVPVAEYLDRFSSDRQHMIDAQGNPIQEFPEWDKIISDNPIWLFDYLKANEVSGSASDFSSVDSFVKNIK